MRSRDELLQAISTGDATGGHGLGSTGCFATSTTLQTEHNTLPGGKRTTVTQSTRRHTRRQPATEGGKEWDKMA